MMLTPRYKHTHLTSLFTYVGCIDIGETVHDIWVIDDQFVERWSDREADARVITDPLTIAALKFWVLKTASAHTDRLDAAVREVRSIVRSIERVKEGSYVDED